MPKTKAPKHTKKTTGKYTSAGFHPRVANEASPPETPQPDSPIPNIKADTDEKSNSAPQSEPVKSQTPPAVAEVIKSEVQKPEEKSDIPSVPSVDPDAPLKIDNLTGRTEVPNIERNAPLKIDEVSITDELSIKEKTNKKLFLAGIMIFTAIIVGTGIFATFWLNNKTNKVSDENLITPTPEIEPTLPVLDKASLTFEVLNGSGVAGAAKKYADNMQSLGYNVVKTGNADKSDYKATLLYVAGNMLDKFGSVLTDLKISSVAGTLTDSTASARIIIGKE